MEKYYRTDFRLIIFFKYIFIGGGDVVFWWTVWNIADYANPIHVTSNGHITFIHGYVFIIVANVCYLTTRKCFKRTLDKYNEVSEQELYPTSIVTITTRKQKRTSKYLLISCLFPVCVYFLALGFIHIWRGLFAIFYYIVEEVLFNKGVSMIVSRIFLQVGVGITLIFNQKNNTVNLCPTHKIFKFDELQYLEILFKMDILNLPNTSNNDNKVNTTKKYKNEEDIITNLNTSAEVLPADKKLERIDNETNRTFKPFDHDFSSAMFFATFLKRFHKSRQCAIFPKKILPIPIKCCCGPTDHIRVNIDILTMISRSCGINFIENVGLLSDEMTASVEADNNKRDTCLCMYVEIYQSITNNDNEYEINTDDVLKNTNNGRKEVTTTDIKLVDHPSPIKTNCTCGSVIVKKFVRKVTPEELKETDVRISSEYNQINTIEGNTLRTTVEPETSPPCGENCLHCRFIHIFAYIYTVHYEQVFLNAFGAIFWSSTWGLFDTATKSIFTNTARDVPWLLLVAIMCHCINHLVLFTIKENTVTLRWRTVCEFLCGINTVCFWASMWHVLDIFALLFSNRLLILIILHVTVFLSLSFFKVSINVAL